MLYLFLAILASSSVAVIMRLGEKHVKNIFAMFAANYFVCAAIAFCFLKQKQPFLPQTGLGFALALGLVSGALYLFCFTLMKLNISKNGVMLASVFMKLGVIIPALIAIVAFHEAPTLWQLAGFIVAAAAIVIIYLEPKRAQDVENAPCSAEAALKKASGGKAFSGFALLMLLLVVSGFTESMVNIYDKAGTEQLKDNFLFFNFLSAFLFSLVMLAVKRDRISWRELMFGVVIGVPNYFSSRFLMLSLGSLPAVAVYPAYNVGAIVLIGLAGMLLFREKPGARKLVGFALIIAALIMLNL